MAKAFNLEDCRRCKPRADGNKRKVPADKVLAFCIVCIDSRIEKNKTQPFCDKSSYWSFSLNRVAGVAGKCGYLWEFFNGEDDSEAVGMTYNSWCHNFDCEYKSTLLLYLFIKIIVLTIDDWSHGSTLVPTLSWPQNELSKLIIKVVFFCNVKCPHKKI